MGPIFEIFSLAVLKISSSFSISESLLSLRYCISLMFNVCAWMEVEIYFHSSQMENDLPWDTSLRNPVFTLCPIYFCASWKLSLSSVFCLIVLLSVAMAGPCYCFIIKLDMGRAHLWCYSSIFGLLLMHFRVSLWSSIKKPYQNVDCNCFGSIYYLGGGIAPLCNWNFSTMQKV